MDDTVVRCPECDARLRVPADRTAVRCPKCKATVRVPARDDEEEEERPVRRPARRDDPDDDDRPRSRRPRRDEDDDDDRPRRRRDEEEDEDDRPRRKKKKSSDDGEGPWLIAALGAVGSFFVMFLGTFAVMGTRGLAEGQDGPTQKLIGLGIGLIVSLILMPLGVFGVRDKVAYGRWHEVTGTTAIILGFVQAIGGGLMGGFCLYGLVFAIVHGR
jgi:hypothetical protein